jgi:hypothetical protein
LARVALEPRHDAFDVPNLVGTRDLAEGVEDLVAEAVSQPQRHRDLGELARR